MLCGGETENSGREEGVFKMSKTARRRSGWGEGDDVEKNIDGGKILDKNEDDDRGGDIKALDQGKKIN